MITYKLVRCRRGLYYPLFVETDRSMPIGIWLDAQVGELLDSTHVRSPVLGRLALRPGWHSCTVPFTDWIGKKGEDGRLLQRRDTVWIECEVEGDQLQISDLHGVIKRADGLPARVHAADIQIGKRIHGEISVIQALFQHIL